MKKKTAKKTGPSVAIPSPDLPPDTNESFHRALDDLKVVFEAAARGSKDAMHHLATLAFKATADLAALGECEGKRIGIESAKPLIERQATLAEIQAKRTHWPIIERIIRDQGKLDLPRALIESGLVPFRMGDDQFDNLPIPEKSFMLTEYLFPLLLETNLPLLHDISESKVSKSNGRKSRRLKTKAEKMRGSTTAEMATADHLKKITSEEIKREKRVPTVSEMRESLESTITARLKTMSPKQKG